MASVHAGPRAAELVGMTRLHSEGPMSPMTVRLWWLGFLALHLVGALFFGLVALAYWELPGIELDSWLQFYELGMKSETHHTVAITHGVIAGFHMLFAVKMVVKAIKYRRLVFGNKKRKLRRLVNATSSRSWRKPGGLRRFAWGCYLSLFARDGFFGVEGRYYDLLLLLRELVETSLQSNQGYRMSRNIPRPWLNGFYVGLLVVNCWSTSILHYVFRHNLVKRRLVTLLCDCLLDLAASVGVPILLVLAYSKEFDTTTGNFEMLKWFYDPWLMNTMSEFQIILVVSWVDLASRMVFAVSMLNNMTTMSWLMTISTESTPRTSPQRAAIAPDEKNDRVTSHATVLAMWKHRLANPSFATKLMQFAFSVWGMLILALHVYAQSNPKLNQCLVQVRPWGVSKPACSLVMLDCQVEGFDGERDLVAAQWGQFDANSVATVRVRGCPSLEVPPLVRSFHSMRNFKVYNSTIVGWGQDAELNQADHPSMSIVMLMRVNLTDGVLPQGLQSPNFPPTTIAFGFLYSNLKELPVDLHLKWPRYMTIHLSYVQMTEFPETLWKLGPGLLNLDGTAIPDIPKELFELEGLWYLDLASTKISALPQDVAQLSPALIGLNLDYTKVSTFWPWIDPWIQGMAVAGFINPVSASNTPYCTERERIFNGELTLFTAVETLSEETAVSAVMDASESNWAFLTSSVGCQPSYAFRYPIAFEDAFQSF